MTLSLKAWRLLINYTHSSHHLHLHSCLCAFAHSSLHNTHRPATGTGAWQTTAYLQSLGPMWATPKQCKCRACISILLFIAYYILLGQTFTTPMNLPWCGGCAVNTNVRVANARIWWLNTTSIWVEPTCATNAVDNIVVNVDQRSGGIVYSTSPWTSWW